MSNERTKTQESPSVYIDVEKNGKQQPQVAWLDKVKPKKNNDDEEDDDDNDEKKKEKMMDEEDSASISSESSSVQPAECSMSGAGNNDDRYHHSANSEQHRRQHLRLLWDREEIERSLARLPAGEAALNLLPSFTQPEQVDAIADKIKDQKIWQSDDPLFLVPTFASGYARKASLLAENEAALSSSLTDLIIKWPSTCLLVATWLNNEGLVKLLLDKGARPSCRDADGRTALHLAASSGQSAGICELLLAHGAEPNEWDFGRICTPLHCAAAAGCPRTLRALVEAKADVNAGLSGKSPLHYAVQSNSTSCTEALLLAGASPNNPQVYTETPLHVAASLGLADCLKLLLAHGADVRVRYGEARVTPLHLAAEEGSYECVRLLLAAGAPVDAKNARGQTALHLATLAQSVETVEILLEARAQVDAQDDNERTAMHAAVVKSIRSNELIRALIQAGASVDKADKFGYTPLHIAALNESSSVVSLLMSKGADLTAKTKGGISALSFIVRRTPEVLPRLVKRLDHAVSLHDHELGDVDCELRLDYRPLVQASSSSCQPQQQQAARGESDLMLCLVEVGQGHVLKHPLCESFLYLKWLKIRKFFLFSLCFHSVYVGLFTAYIGLTYLWEVPRAGDVLFWFVLAFIMALASKELFQVAHGITIYAKGWENVLQWSVIVSSALVLVEPRRDWQHHVAGVAILLVWVELMMIVGRFPMFGIYVQMFTQVAVNFFKFLGAYLCLVVGFSLAFSVLHRGYKSFKNPLVGLLKTIIMLSGELEFEDVFFDEEAPVLYPGTTHLIMLAFVVLVTVILANLMMGLAVSDIQELRQCAGLDRLVRRAELVAHLENLLFSKLLDYAPKKLVRACRTGALLLRLPHHCAIHIRPNDPRESRLPKELIKSIYHLVSERKTRHKYRCRGESFKSTFDSDVDSRSKSNQRFSASYNFEPDSQAGLLNELSAELRAYVATINSKLDVMQTRMDTMGKGGSS
ncbi:transient receptor potential channel pyrexia-like [Trichogramma pretiosum]|uniref:transient receptor potential channel pyrexia-like n=1 Tax=Trichogramma pretiosum TaxID=7493 RepID=UPI0006C9C82C|nr:transient receptor potential channel pyrexia-like [Trichogramma pretiosum]